jgi:hypothetical protein
MKTVSIISIVYGTLGIIWSTIILGVFKIEEAIVSNIPFPDEALEIIDIPTMFEVLHGIMSFLMPFVLLIGAVYIVSGILGINGKSQAYVFGMLAAVFNIFWYVAYVIILQMELVPLFTFNEVFPAKLFNMFFLMGTLINAIFYCAYPVFLIIFLSQRRQQQ